MISKEHRFQGLGSLRFVYRRGDTVRGPLYSLKAVRNNRHDAYRAAVVVSRKVNKSAVVRNRIRRRLYESLRQIENQIVSPHDLVITVFSDKVVDEPAGSLQKQLQKQLRQAGVIE